MGCLLTKVKTELSPIIEIIEKSTFKLANISKVIEFKKTFYEDHPDINRLDLPSFYEVF